MRGVVRLAFLPLLLSSCSPGPPPESISGTITVAPALEERAAKVHTLFIIALPEGGGPPLAVQRFARPKFPLRYFLTGDDQIMQGRPFRGRVRVLARLSASGTAGGPRPGDLEGRHAGAVEVGARGVDIVIEKPY